MRNPTIDEMFGETHPFVGTGDQCEHIVNDYIGPCACVRENEIHSAPQHKEITKVTD